MFLWIGLALVGGYYAWKYAHRYPEIPVNADIPTLFNFPPFMLETGKETFSYHLAPEGLTNQQVLNAFGAQDAKIARGHIPIPGVSSVPAFADLWAIHSVYNGPSRTITPAIALQDGGVPAIASNVDSPRQLTALLYASAVNPTTLGKERLISIAAKQA